MMRCQPALGTYVEIQAGAHGPLNSPVCEAALAHAIDQAFAAIATVQACMSVFDPQSDLARINAGAFLHTPGPIHPWLWSVLSLAKEVHALSPAFDPCAGYALVDRGLRPAHGHTAQATRGTLHAVRLLQDHHVLTTEPVYLDLGGIAKGEAVDRAVAALQAHGVTAGCVNAGGDLRVFGPHPQPIYVRHPGAPQHTTHVGHLQDGALATSGDYFAAADAANAIAGHLIDPQHGDPVADPRAASARSFSVMAPRCAVADALTKVYAITGDAHHPAMRHFGAQALELSA